MAGERRVRLEDGTRLRAAYPAAVADETHLNNGLNPEYEGLVADPAGLRMEQLRIQRRGPSI